MARELLKTKNDEQVEKVTRFISEGSAYAVKVDNFEGGFCDDRIFIEGNVFYDSMAEIVDCLRIGNDNKYTIGQIRQAFFAAFPDRKLLFGRLERKLLNQ